MSGAALLVSPRGEVALVSGTALDVDLEGIARRAIAVGGANAHEVGNACVHALPVTMGWMLCVVSTLRVHPGPILERLRRAGAVMALALVDGSSPMSGEGGSSPSGAPAVVSPHPRRSN